MSELRCDNGILFGILDEDVVEVRCKSNFCGHQAGVIVLHRFSTKTGELVSTNRFKDPIRKREEVNKNATRSIRSPVRHSGHQAQSA